VSFQTGAQLRPELLLKVNCMALQGHDMMRDTHLGMTKADAAPFFFP
jgi:hypothetical protein